jgi:hydroxyacylglutathione hydrolase
MYIEQLYTNCLAEAAYYIESEGEAMIVDPLRETAPYLEMAAARGTTIKYIFETHFHADFVSGHIDLAALTGATIVYGPGANPEYKAHIAVDGETFRIGKLTVKVLHTPGHTLESSCYLLQDESGKDYAIFTGDTLFVGAVGRPDLAVQGEHPVTPAELGSMMFDSLNNKIMPLADEVLVYPAHGPGSSCGKGIGKETWSTIGIQKATNYALQPMSREEFIAQVTDNLPAPPAYFFQDARINQTGYENIEDVMARNAKALSQLEVLKAIAEGALVLDTRGAEAFEAAFIPGAINIGLNGGFAVWVGTLLPIDKQLIIVAEEGREAESILRLARVGYEKVVGYLQGGMAAWQAPGLPTDKIESIAPEALNDHLAKERAYLIDVRKPSEYAAGHVLGAKNLELDTLEQNLSLLNPNESYVVQCQGGYRSMIAASLMRAHGFKHVMNVSGGFAALSKTDIGIGKIESLAV